MRPSTPIAASSRPPSPTCAFPAAAWTSRSCGLIALRWRVGTASWAGLVPNLGRSLDADGADVVYRDGAGLDNRFVPDGQGGYASPDGLYAVLAEERRGLAVRFRHGIVARFDPPDRGGRLRGIEDRNRNAIRIAYPGTTGSRCWTRRPAHRARAGGRPRARGPRPRGPGMGHVRLRAPPRRGAAAGYSPASPTARPSAIAMTTLPPRRARRREGTGMAVGAL